MDRVVFFFSSLLCRRCDQRLLKGGDQPVLNLDFPLLPISSSFFSFSIINFFFVILVYEKRLYVLAVTVADERASGEKLLMGSDLED